MKDLHGLEYVELLAIQERQLVMWAEKLRPELAKAVTHYVYAQNKCSPDLDHKHHVLRGQDIIQIIMEWPSLSPAYPPVQAPQPPWPVSGTAVYLPCNASELI